MEPVMTPVGASGRPVLDSTGLPPVSVSITPVGCSVYPGGCNVLGGVGVPCFTLLVKRTNIIQAMQSNARRITKLLSGYICNVVSE